MSQNPEEEALKNRVKETPDDIDSWIDLGNFHLRSKNFAEAEAYRKALKLDTKNSISLFQLH